MAARKALPSNCSPRSRARRLTATKEEEEALDDAPEAPGEA